MTQGRFISFEGADGVGKSTQIHRLKDALQKRGFDVLLTREPGGTPEAEDIRKLLLEEKDWTALTETLLHYAARTQHIDRLIRPVLKQGRWVLSDRFFDSSFVYQGHAGDMALDRLQALHDLILEGFTPDLTFILDLEGPIAARRRKQRGQNADRYEKKGEIYQEKLRAGYRLQAKTHPTRCILLDAEGTEEVVAERIWACVQKRFPEP